MTVKPYERMSLVARGEAVFSRGGHTRLDERLKVRYSWLQIICFLATLIAVFALTVSL